MKTLFNTFSKFCMPKNENINLPFTPDEFSEYFIEKIEKIRSQIPQVDIDFNLNPTTKPLKFTKFELTNEEEVRNFIIKSNKTNTPNEIFPSKMYMQILPTILPYLVKLFNSSLESGVVPSSFKHAIVKPLIKKPNLDLAVLSNYRPVSLLPFLSKILERLVQSRIDSHIEKLDLPDTFQSGFRQHHSTETALLKVTNDIRVACDTGNVCILITLDLSSAFDTLDPGVLIDRLHSFLGISDTALNWFKSYLSSRTQEIITDKGKSKTKNIKFGVPQGSVEGPPLFKTYILPLLMLLKQLGLLFHCYADDTQIYFLCTPKNYLMTIPHIETCYKTISQWLSKNFLKLNDSKTEVIVIGSDAAVSSCKSALSTFTLGNANIEFSTSIKSLGVTLDESLSFTKHIKIVSNNCMFQLHNLNRVRSHFSKSSLETIIHAYISTRLDYCNSLYSGLPDSTIRTLQVAQNFAARILLQESKFCHITPLLKKLHWLPIRARIEYKILLFT